MSAAAVFPVGSFESRRELRLRRSGAGAEACPSLTLLELVRAVGEVTDDEAEVVATIVHMLRSGAVRLSGTFRDEPAEDFSR